MNRPKRWGLWTVALVLAATGCGQASRAQTVEPDACAAEMDHDGSGMLQVLDIWPKTTSTFSGFLAVEFDRAACAPVAHDLSAAPDCSRLFPWLADDPVDTTVILGGAGVRRLVNGVIRGHHEVPEGQVVYAQEIRETVLVLDPAESAEQHIVTKAARQCGSVLPGPTGTVLQVSIASEALDTNIVAVLAVAGDRLVWLEFDEVGWHQEDYLPVVDQAIAAAHRL